MYEVGPLDFLAFNGLEIPCIQEIIITLHELDTKDSDSYSIRIPCNELGDVSSDFKFGGYKIHAEAREWSDSTTIYEAVEVAATLETS